MILNDRRYNRNRSVSLKIIVLFIFNSDQAPLRTSETFTHNHNERHYFEIVEWTVGIAQRHQSDQPRETQNKVTHHRIVIKPRLVVNFVSQGIRAFLFTSEQAPIHVDVPRIAVRAGPKMQSHIPPER